MSLDVMAEVRDAFKSVRADMRRWFRYTDPIDKRLELRSAARKLRALADYLDALGGVR